MKENSTLGMRVEFLLVISKNILTLKLIHFFSEEDYMDTVAPTCVEGYTAGYYSNDCEAYITGEVIAAVDEHTLCAAIEENYVAPECNNASSYDSVVYCDVCDEEISRDTVAVDALTHTDANGDFKCDNSCGYEFENPADTCKHMCHKTGIMGIFGKIVNFIFKFLKRNPICQCGVAHY